MDRLAFNAAAAINEMRTDNLGKSWSAPHDHADTLGRRTVAGGRPVRSGQTDRI